MIDLTIFLFIAIPALIGVINSKRYNIIYGLVSVFTFAFFIYFILIESEIVPIDLIESFDHNCVYIGLENMNMAYVAPLKNMLEQVFIIFGLDNIWANIVDGNPWKYFGFIFICSLVIHIISGVFRGERKKKLKQLRKDARR